MKKNVLLMSFLALLSLGCSEIEDDLETENRTQSLDQNRGQYSEGDIYITKQNFTINVEELRGKSTGLIIRSNKTGNECEDTSINTDSDLGYPRIGERMNFVYSSHYEPELVYNNGPKNGPTKIFHAVKRGLNTVENAIKELNKTNGQQKKHNLFTVSYTNAPIYDDHTNMTTWHGPGWGEYNNYAGRDFSYDGINSIAWANLFPEQALPDEEFINTKIPGWIFTVWDRNGYILERDIILQNNEFMSWAIKSDLTSKEGGTLDCSPEIDIQAVITHFALQSVGLRPLHDGLAFEANDATIFKPTGWGWGPWVVSNEPFLGWHPQNWQTLTPGDKQGAWEAAPENGFVMEPDIIPIPDANQLILHYDFDDDLASGIVEDQSGNNLEGNIVGILEIETGIRNSAARFANNSYIDLGGENFPGEKLPLTGFSLGVWVKPDLGSFNNSFSQSIFRAMSHMDNQLLCYFTPFDHNNVLESSTSTSGPSNTSVIEFFNASVLEDQWFHYAVTFDTASGEYAMYIDGVMVIQDVKSIPTLIENWDKLAFIGAGFEGGGASFTGLMDDFALYNYALSASDIENLKTSGPGAINNP